MYHFGVAQAMLDSGVVAPHDAPDATRFVGTSAGALVASSMAGHLDIQAMRDFALECGDHVRARPWRLVGMERYIVWSVQRFAAKVMAQDEATGRSDVADMLSKTLEVYATALPKIEPLILTGFKNLDDAVEALRASCCLVPFVGLPFRLRATQQWVIDGGFCAFQPRDGELGVVTVATAPLAPADITPSIAMPYMWFLRPPAARPHRAVFDVGYRDALRYLVAEEYIDAAAQSRLLEAAGCADEAALRSRLGVDGSWALWLESALVLVVHLLVLRPLSVLVLYAELWLVLLFDVVRAVGTAVLLAPLGRSSASAVRQQLHRAYEKGRNAMSLRVFARVVLGGARWVPINEPRLHKHSRVYRLLLPLVFSHDRAEGERMQRVSR
jgi:hypothetical protein